MIHPQKIVSEALFFVSYDRGLLSKISHASQIRYNYFFFSLIIMYNYIKFHILTYKCYNKSNNITQIVVNLSSFYVSFDIKVNHAGYFLEHQSHIKIFRAQLYLEKYWVCSRPSNLSLLTYIEHGNLTDSCKAIN